MGFSNDISVVKEGTYKGMKWYIRKIGADRVQWYSAYIDYRESFISDKVDINYRDDGMMGWDYYKPKYINPKTHSTYLAEMEDEEAHEIVLKDIKEVIDEISNKDNR